MSNSNSKSRSKIGLIVVIGILVVGILWGINARNSIVAEYENVQASSSDIEAALQQRNDKIPNLVATVKGYAAHEEKLYAEITEARAKLAGAMETGNNNEMVEADAKLTSAVTRLIGIVEDNPDFKADETYRALMDELSEVENILLRSRKNYNDEAQSYNTMIKQFPNNIIAIMSGYKELDYFHTTNEAAKEAPTVEF